MKIHFYGTGASEGFPSLFCVCENCRKARELGGKNIRTRSSLQIDKELLIDFSPDTYAHTLFGGLDLTKIQYLLITHSHPDHFLATDVANILPPMAVVEDNRRLSVYGNEKVMGMLEKILRFHSDSKGRMPLHILHGFETVQLGEYEVTSLKANHMEEEECLLYVVSKGGKSFLYGHDTSMFSEETWEHLKAFRLDCVVLDCTSVDISRHFKTHMGFEENIEIKERMMREGIAGEHTIFISSHFAHSFAPFHDRLTEKFKPYGFIPAYDGMEITF